MTGNSEWPKDEFVPVMVPKSMVTSVYAFIGTQDGKLVDSGSEPGSLPHDAHESDWSVENFQLLLRDRRPSVARIIVILDVLARRAETQLATTELARETGLSRGELRGALSGLTRVCKTMRPGNEMDWPIRWTFGKAQQKGLDQETYYWLPAEAAQRWRQVRGS